MARVMKLLNYQPESTIRFILFAGEEMGFMGSKFQAGKSKQTGEDIRFMFNMDMIAYNPDSLNQVYLFRYDGSESAFELASGAFQQYTGLEVSTGPADFLHRSDSYIYWQNGFQATWAFEYDFNDYYHSANDLVSNCNLAYCAEVTRGVMAGILEMQYRPFPQGLKAHSSKGEYHPLMETHRKQSFRWLQGLSVGAKRFRIYPTQYFADKRHHLCGCFGGEQEGLFLPGNPAERPAAGERSLCNCIGRPVFFYRYPACGGLHES